MKGMEHLIKPIITIGILILLAIFVKWAIVVFFEAILYSINNPAKVLFYTFCFMIIFAYLSYRNNR